MLTEDHVRHLLAEAANTIKPGPEPDVEPPPRRWRLPLVAAAAVVLIAGVLVTASLYDGGSVPTPTAPRPSLTSPRPSAFTPSTSSTSSTSVDTFLGDPSFHLGPDQIPPVVGYPPQVAARILQQHGWVVSERPEAGCPPDTATAVYPSAGAVTAPGTIVVLTINANGGPSDTSSGPGCPTGSSGTAGASGTSDPFLLWAERLGVAPSFAGGVRYVETADTATDIWLSPVEAQSLSNWPHLSDLVSAATTPDVRETRSGLAIVPRTVVAGVGPNCSSFTSCEDRTLTVRSGGRVIMSVLYTLTSDGSIDSVTIHDHRRPTAQGNAQGNAQDGAPDVVGDSEAYATARLEAWGYAVSPVYRVDCAPAGVVSRLAIEGRNAFVAVTTGTGQCDSSPLAPQLSHPRPATHVDQSSGLDHYRVTAADAFIAFAHGSADSPAWADRVAYTIDGRRIRTLTASQAQRAASWVGCPASYKSLHCPVSPLAELRSLARAGGAPRITAAAPYSPCLPTPGTLPTPADAASGTVTIMPGTTIPGHSRAGCASMFYVTLGLDGYDRVSSVDLSLPAA